MVWAWSRRLFGETTALISVLVFTMLPPILGHAGLATTDMAAAATCAAALYAFARWLDQGDTTRSLVLALSVALAVLSKFTALPFLPACAVALLAWRWWHGKDAANPAPVGWKQRVLAVGLTALGACLLVWAGYRFSIGSLRNAGAPPSHRALDAHAGRSRQLLYSTYSAVASIPLPAPEFFRGVRDAKGRISIDEGAYALGRIHYGQCWYFFLLALAVKSPVAFLILVGVGVVILLKRSPYRADWRPLAPAISAAAILAVTLPVEIHMGVRHILAVYPLLSIAAGFGAVSLWQNAARRRWARAATLLLLGWLIASSVQAHPDYLAYFNEFTGSHPERILVDSDLDWGQDLWRLGDVLRSRQVDKLTLSYFGTADPSRHGLPPFIELAPFKPTTGWIAISITNLKWVSPRHGGMYSWLEAYQPVALAGRSIWLYYIPGTPSDAPKYFTRPSPRSGRCHVASVAHLRF